MNLEDLDHFSRLPDRPDGHKSRHREDGGHPQNASTDYHPGIVTFHEDGKPAGQVYSRPRPSHTATESTTQ